jgi:diacylglycerol kinase family enzyme
MNHGRYNIIVNPTSGRGSDERSIPYLKKSLLETGGDFDLARTQIASHAIDIVRKTAVPGLPPRRLQVFCPV